jgi:hypothetical protein
VALIHPDLGIGGAERLVVDAALELSALGYEVRRRLGFRAQGIGLIFCRGCRELGKDYSLAF